MDFFLDDQPLQPKKVIGDYVEKNGILVPQRYGNLKEAIRSREEVIARSEHPEEYTRLCGILQSAVFKPEQLSTLGSEENLLNHMLNRNANAMLNYFLVTGREDLQEDFSISLWKFIPGINVSMVADSCIKDRYHLYIRERGYARIERGQVQTSRVRSPLEGVLLYTVDLYEKVRNLPLFNPEHCPIIELQIKPEDSEIFFLQYHRTRDKKDYDQKIEREAQDNECEAFFVRGYTSSEPEEYTLLIRTQDTPENFSKIGEEDIEMDIYYNSLGSLLRSPHRKASVRLHSDPESLGDRVGHFDLASFFKPECATIFPEKEFFDKLLPDYRNLVIENRESGGGGIRIPIRFAADGRRALISRIF